MGQKGKPAVIGIDIGGTKTLCALFDQKFRLIEEVKFKTDPVEGRRTFVHQITKAIKHLLRAAREHKLDVLGAGGAIAAKVDNKRGLIKSAPNILCLEDFSMRNLFNRQFGFDIVLGNDVQWGLYGEHQFGAAIGCDHVIGVFLGTGVGGAVIFNSRLHEGASGFGGQVGSILTFGLGHSNGDDSYGMINELASKPAVAGAALGLGAKQWAPYLYRTVGTDLAKVSWGALAKSIRHGDVRIRQLLTGRLRALGVALSSVVNFANPNMLVLGGGMTEQMPKLVLHAVERGLRDYLLPEVSRALKIRAARLENRAGVYGAGKRAFESFYHPPTK
jgi:glucokinase